MSETNDNVFSDQQTTNTEVKIQLDDWVGEGKKFATVEQLVESYGHAQNHISTVENSYSELQGELENRETVKEMLLKLQTPQATDQDQGGDTQGADAETQLSAEDIAALIDKRVGDGVDSFAERSQANANEMVVSETLSKRFGGLDQAKKMLTDKASKLGMSKEDLQTLARGNPSIVLEMFPSDANQSTQMQGSVNTDSPEFNKGSQNTRNAEYYRKLRRENRSAYFDPKNQLQMIQDKKDLGADFGD